MAFLILAGDNRLSCLGKAAHRKREYGDGCGDGDGDG